MAGAMFWDGVGLICSDVTKYQDGRFQGQELTVKGPDQCQFSQITGIYCSLSSCPFYRILLSVPSYLRGSYTVIVQSYVERT